VQKIDYNKGRTCPCRRRSFWNCNDQDVCPQAVADAMRDHNVRIVPIDRRR